MKCIEIGYNRSLDCIERSNRGERFVKKTLLSGVLAAPVMMFAMTLAHADSAPTTCSDGTTSTATGRGACSGHGGVQTAAKGAAPAAAAPATPAAAPAAKPAAAPAAAGAAPAGATAKCKDGSYSKSKSHSGACSKHGGVDSWMDAK
jgi:hypothetical protein